jgi:YD repeat-containing protein
VVRQDANGKQLSKTVYSYDPHGRQTQVTDERSGTTNYRLDNADQVVQVNTPPPAKDQPSQSTTTEYDLMGRPVKMIHSDGNVVQQDYYPSGQLKATYGARTYPVEYTYDAQGRKQTMTTYQDYAKRQGAAMTTWNYHPQRGWLVSKQYADGTGPQYEYYLSGKLKTRKWARGIVTSYGYSQAGELISTVYSDGTTPSVTTEFDRMGRVVRISQAGKATKRSYNSASQLLSESYTGGPLDGLLLNNAYDGLLRRTTLQASLKATPSPNSNLPSTLYAVSYTYDAASRLSAVSEGDESVTYSYLANSPLVENISYRHSEVLRN